MENQHRKIKGYRELDEPEISYMNLIKEKGNEIGNLIESVRVLPGVDPRWVAIAQTDLQKGIMALIRAIAKPESF